MRLQKIVYAADLLIDVTKWPSKRARSLSNRHIRKAQVFTKCHNIVECRIPCRWDILKSKRAGDSEAPLLQVLILPNPPSSVNLCVVVPEVGVRWRVVEIGTGIAADRLMATKMNAESSRGGVLERSLESGYVGAGSDQFGDVGIGSFG